MQGIAAFAFIPFPACCDVLRHGVVGEDFWTESKQTPISTYFQINSQFLDSNKADDHQNI